MRSQTSNGSEGSRARDYNHHDAVALWIEVAAKSMHGEAIMFRLTSLLLASTALVLAGCTAGRDFVRPASETLNLGQTTYSQVTQQLGEPRAIGNLHKNEKNIKTISYAYAASMDEPLEYGVIPARSNQYFFLDDVLVGHQFLSSFKSDNSYFDESKIETIQKGKTSRAEVIQLLGPPTGFYVSPMVKSTAGVAIGYGYIAARRGPYSSARFARKSLLVSFDAKDLVSDTEFSSAY
jgi:hypothetical protein